ncbi:hypothetical protein L202_03868 [Cryptococcus amylolentus CBS 6039]|uniref:Uncharacterized protein n=1 Tax=Cryptococcus amylolentus CBS 6039 TaxID=1295533 RepID=A0A1E3HUI7_9TREE|nr:hypothetical protein L202_03868 [Cryptococcus amylolentus CBS 6039]ODN80003.1 hypothetical protein L202_03868 [Cryptococcus amylolentus CBS 6039]
MSTTLITLTKQLYNSLTNLAATDGSPAFISRTPSSWYQVYDDSSNCFDVLLSGSGSGSGYWIERMEGPEAENVVRRLRPSARLPSLLRPFGAGGSGK